MYDIACKNVQKYLQKVLSHNATDNELEIFHNVWSKSLS